MSPGVEEAFGEAAFFQELPFQVAKLVVEEVVGLVDQAEEGVGGFGIDDR